MKILGVEIFPNGYDRFLVLKGKHPYFQIPARDKDVMPLKDSLVANGPPSMHSNIESTNIDFSL